jgi:hypothetical protein
MLVRGESFHSRPTSCFRAWKALWVRLLDQIERTNEFEAEFMALKPSNL